MIFLFSPPLLSTTPNGRRRTRFLKNYFYVEFWVPTPLSLIVTPFITHDSRLIEKLLFSRNTSRIVRMTSRKDQSTYNCTLNRMEIANNNEAMNTVKTSKLKNTMYQRFHRPRLRKGLLLLYSWEAHGGYKLFISC